MRGVMEIDGVKYNIYYGVDLALGNDYSVLSVPKGAIEDIEELAKNCGYPVFEYDPKTFKPKVDYNQAIREFLRDEQILPKV